MRQFQLFFSFLLFTFSLSAQKQLPITCNWTFIGIEEGYDHMVKAEIWMDNTLIKTSESFKESDMASCKFSVPAGLHTLQIKMFVFYNGIWEEHSIENEYSIDCQYVEMRNFTKKDSFAILWDLDGGINPPAVTWGKQKKKKN